MYGLGLVMWITKPGQLSSYGKVLLPTGDTVSLFQHPFTACIKTKKKKQAPEIKIPSQNFMENSVHFWPAVFEFLTCSAKAQLSWSVLFLSICQSELRTGISKTQIDGEGALGLKCVCTSFGEGLTWRAVGNEDKQMFSKRTDYQDCWTLGASQKEWLVLFCWY